jgi:hypothetical protein
VPLPRWVDARWNTSGGNEAYIILHRGARSRGYKRRERERERERVRSCGEAPELASAASLLLCLPLLVYVVPVCLCLFPVIACLLSPCLRKALDIPFYRYKEMPSCTMGCSYVLTWLAGKCLEPCTGTNMAVGEVT